MGLVIVTAPTVEPIHLEDAKAHLHVEHHDEDGIIASKIAAARRWAEDYVSRAFIDTVLRLELPAFPGSNSDPLVLPRPPLSAVASVKYLDEDGVVQTWATANYVVDSDEPAQLWSLEAGTGWPTTITRHPAAVKVEYTAGYGTTEASVPENVRDAIRLKLTDLYVHRGDEPAGRGSSAAEALLDPYRVQLIGGG